MGRKSKQQLLSDSDYVKILYNLLRLTTTDNDDVKAKYKLYLTNEKLSLYQKKYFKSLVFGEISFSETSRKMEKLMESDINRVSFEGKELKNIQQFLRKSKLNNNLK